MEEPSQEHQVWPPQEVTWQRSRHQPDDQRGLDQLWEEWSGRFLKEVQTYTFKRVCVCVWERSSSPRLITVQYPTVNSCNMTHHLFCFLYYAHSSSLTRQYPQRPGVTTQTKLCPPTLLHLSSIKELWSAATYSSSAGPQLRHRGSVHTHSSA